MRGALQKLLLIALFAVITVHGDNRTLNGFVLMDGLVPAEKVFHGGPPKDGIPALDTPDFIQAAEAAYLRPSGRVIGVYRQGQARAYPIAILNYHEIVNDRFGEEGVTVTFCPLCGTGMTFKTPEGVSSFGVSDLLYNSDVLLYDRDTHSLWSQLRMQAVFGSLAGRRLTLVESDHTTWADWHARHPDTLVLSRETGHMRSYQHSPYAGYKQSRRVYFPVDHSDHRYHPKEQVVGVVLDGLAYASPFRSWIRPLKLCV